MSQNELIISVSGIRGIVGESLTPEIVTAFAAAMGTYLEGRPVVVSRDSRPSGVMLENAVVAGLTSAGCDVHPLGILPTPTCGFLIRRLQAAGGIQITASHNPAPYNGLKLFGPRGMVLTVAEGEEVLRVYRREVAARRAVHKVGTRLATTKESFYGHHWDRILDLIDYRSIQSRSFRVLLDANHGAGGPLALWATKTFGWCRVIPVGCEPDGLFAHEPEPTEANLRDVAPLVSQNHCDIGFALDPDADRLAIIDETGRYIGEELTLALATEFRLREQRGPVVVNMSTSRVMEDIANKYGCLFSRAPVGEVNVAEKMIEVNAVIGGEGNGGVIDPRVGFVRDPFIGMALILNLMAQTGKRVSELVAELPRYHIVKDKHSVDRSGLPTLYDRLKAHWPTARVNDEDGLRLDWPDRWVHVRPSNTEPIVRVIAEAPLSVDAGQLCQEVRIRLRNS